MNPAEKSTAARVLIADDEDDQRNGLASIVSSWGFEVETAADGQQALEKLASFPAHVLITDLDMPRLDGFGLLEQIAAQGGGPAAIVLTAFGSIENAIKTVHDLGAFWFLEKPVQAAALSVLLGRAAAQGRMAEQTDRLRRELS
jgi:DNA-binding NtrC family response regulator